MYKKRLSEYTEQYSHDFTPFKHVLYSPKTVHVNICFFEHCETPKMIINIQRLRSDIKDNYGTAMFNGFPAAMIDLAKVDRMSDQEIVEYALKKNMRLEKYIIQE